MSVNIETFSRANEAIASSGDGAGSALRGDAIGALRQEGTEEFGPDPF